MDDADPVFQVAGNGWRDGCVFSISPFPTKIATRFIAVAAHRNNVLCHSRLGWRASTEDIRELLLAGADKVSINTAAVHNPEFVGEAAERFGSQCIVVAIDAKQTGPGKWEIFTHGGRKATGIDAVKWAQNMADRGAGEIITSADRDGTRVGFDNVDPNQLIRSYSAIASGGVGTLDHLVDGIRQGHASVVLRIDFPSANSPLDTKALGGLRNCGTLLTTASYTGLSGQKPEE